MWDTVVTDDVDARLHRVRPLPRQSEGAVDVQAIVTFLHALTDPAFDDLSDTVPATVPSGQPLHSVGVLDLGPGIGE